MNKNCRPLKKSEVPKGIKVDLKSQRLLVRSDGRRYGIMIDVICIKCGTITVYPVGSLRWKFKKGFSGCCKKCHPRFRPIKPKGGRRKSGVGYVYLHTDIIEPEIVECAKRHGANIHSRNNYIAEHRVVAYRKFGEIVFEKGMCVRHLDGNKSNNHPDNLAIGTNQDNIDDHVSSRREAARWRTIAIFLFSILKNQRSG